MASKARPCVLHEATFPQAVALKPNLAVLPWGATEAHGHHLPYGTDVVEATALGRHAVEDANARGVRCILLPAVPFGMNHDQLYQVATITMRASTQRAVLMDVAHSLVRQGIDRLVVLNFHGGNEFRSMVRDVMFELPIFVAAVDGYRLAHCDDLMANGSGDHAGELESSLMLHIAPQWVDMQAAGDGKACASKLPAFSSTPGVWAPRDWRHAAPDTGIGNPKAATAAKGKAVLDRLVGALAPVLVELSQAVDGQYPFVIRGHGRADATGEP